MRLHVEASTLQMIGECVSVVTPRAVCTCPHCGLPVAFPLIARQDQIEQLQRMITAAGKWCHDNGMTNDIVVAIRAAAAIRQAKKKP